MSIRLRPPQSLLKGSTRSVETIVIDGMIRVMPTESMIQGHPPQRANKLWTIFPSTKFLQPSKHTGIAEASSVPTLRPSDEVASALAKNKRLHEPAHEAAMHLWVCPIKGVECPRCRPNLRANTCKFLVGHMRQLATDHL